MAAVTPKKLARINSPDRVLNMIQDNVASVLDAVASKEVVNGVLVDVDLVVGDNQVSHGLGRPWQGWHIADQTSATATATIYRSGDPRPDRVLQLFTNIACTVKLWIF
jgi:hypothetical protein